MAEEKEPQPETGADAAPASETPAPAEQPDAAASPEATPPAETPAEKPAEKPAASDQEAAKESPDAAVKEAQPAAEAAPAEAKEAPAAPEAAAPEAAAGEAEAAPAAPRRRVKGAKNVPLGIVHIKASFNNTAVTITDMSGASIAWANAGRCGFKGSRKSTAYAATVVAQEAARAAQVHGLQEVEIRVQGPGAGRESAIRAIQSAGLSISAIKDVTPVPHNGCRPPKRRRV